MQGSVVVYHKHPTSARTLFLRFPWGSIVGLGELPKLSVVAEAADSVDDEDVLSAIEQVQELLSLDEGQLLRDEEFLSAVEIPGEIRPVYLLKLKMMDPPFERIEELGGKFIALTEARGLPDFELLLLQMAYKAIMEG